MYTAVFDSMESSLNDAVKRERMDQNELRQARMRELAVRSKVKLPISEFYAESRFHHGKGGKVGVMRRQVDDAFDGEIYCSSYACCDPTGFTVAVIRCLSCAKFDPRRRGHYCARCFKARHPGHRAQHSWVPIKESEHLERQLRYRNALAERKVFGDEISSVVTDLNRGTATLARMKSDTDATNLLRDVDTRVHDVNVRVARLRRALRAPALQPLGNPLQSSLVTKGLMALFKSKQKSRATDPRYRKSTDDPSEFAENRSRDDRALALPPLTPPAPSSRGASRKKPRDFAQLAMWEVVPEHAAASLFARAFRKHKARVELGRAVRARFMKVYDANTGFYYFVDSRTRGVSWEPPKVLWNDERYRATASRDGVDPVVCKREAMARAAAKIMTPRSWAEKHKPKNDNLESMREEESDAESGADSEESEEGDDDGEGGGGPSRPSTSASWREIPDDHEIFDPDFDADEVS